MKLKLKNIGVGIQNVRIIRLTSATTLDNSEGIFSKLDPNGIEYGINLGEPEAISCDGASPIVGSVSVGPMDGGGRTSIYLNDKLIGVADNDHWFDDIFSDNSTDDARINAFYLQDWVPSAPAQS